MLLQYLTVWTALYIIVMCYCGFTLWVE